MNLENKTIGDVMTHSVVFVDVSDSLSDVDSLMARKSIRHIPVTDAGKLVGIISKTDINRLSFSGLFTDDSDEEISVFDLFSIEEVMRHNPRTVKQEEPIAQAIQILVNEEFHALPVVNSSNDLCGIITTTDLLKLML